MILLAFFLTFLLPSSSHESQEYLYVWAGDAERVHPDIVGIVDFDPRSRHYGQILKIVHLVGPSAINNEPHHARFDVHKKYFYTGGLLSLLKPNGTDDEVFSWTTNDPKHPIQRHLKPTTAHPPHSGAPDEFFSLRDGSLLLTMMGDASGNSPGRIVLLDKEGNAQEYPTDPPTDGCFNPHGISADERIGVIVTGDFVTPSSLLKGPPNYCNTIRIWDMETMKITKKITLPGVYGIMNVNFVPHDKKHRFIASVPTDPSGNPAYLYVFDLQDSEPYVFNITPYLTGTSGRCYTRINNEGTRLILGTSISGQVFLIDISNLKHFKVLDYRQVAAGMHYVIFSRDQKRVAISAYFLNMDGEGVVHQDGERTVHVWNIEKDYFEPEVVVDFRDVDGISYRPHGMDVWWPTKENQHH